MESPPWRIHTKGSVGAWAVLQEACLLNLCVEARFLGRLENVSHGVVSAVAASCTAFREQETGFGSGVAEPFGQVRHSIEEEGSGPSHKPSLSYQDLRHQPCPVRVRHAALTQSSGCRPDR